MTNLATGHSEFGGAPSLGHFWHNGSGTGLSRNALPNCRVASLWRGSRRPI